MIACCLCSLIGVRVSTIVLVWEFCASSISCSCTLSIRCDSYAHKHTFLDDKLPILFQ